MVLINHYAAYLLLISSNFKDEPKQEVKFLFLFHNVHCSIIVPGGYGYSTVIDETN